MVNKALFISTSDEKPAILTISFKDDPTASLGTELVNCDRERQQDIFLPSYALIHKLIEGQDEIARKYGIARGDCIVAVNGLGFRRFLPDYDESKLVDLTRGVEQRELTDEEKERKFRVMTGEAKGEVFKALVARIKDIKSKADPDFPLELQLERHGWDSRANCLGRFLDATDNKIVDCMGLLQKHEDWKEEYFPIDMTDAGLQAIIQLQAVSGISKRLEAPTIFVDYGKIQQLELSHSSDDVVRTLVIFTEILLASCTNPRSPKTCHLIDLSDPKAFCSFRIDVFVKFYEIIGQHYPETLYKVVLYPVPDGSLQSHEYNTMIAALNATSQPHVMAFRKTFMAKSILKAMNDRGKKSIVMTESLEDVCDALGWEIQDVVDAGGLKKFARKCDTITDDLISEAL